MSSQPLPAFPQCPDPSTRAPRVPSGSRGPHSRLYLAPPALQGAIVAILCRDTRGFELSDAQRLSHFPASPRVCLSWFQGLDAGLVEQVDGGPLWSPFGTAVTISGSQSRPTVCWAPNSGRGGMVCFAADAAQALFGVDLSIAQDRIVPAGELLGETWRPFLEALLAADGDTASLAVLEQHLAARWRALRGGGSALSSLREAGRYWVERLAWQAHEWRRTHSPRQVERRIKAHSGRSLREWQSLVKTEGLFFNARERYETGQPLDWAAIAQDEGFADQAHLSRAVKRSTGFSPSEFTQRFIEDESFWVYRLWV
ncbi:helix-turn-helix domain-containing protein [Trinickia terrae]|uniref:Helix-turn-helix domain-containing protein n=1 Tax=Trinickia terrae TaxID=2571161 RepID=A0A4U1HGP3_9BURK|nr:helix-turn-helix domain-containing protein [Trinickia terrae]TKC80235.1 helix-turn-helix domain-containing protein [Trinickia terrae]